LFTPAEQAALSFTNKFAGDHYAIGEDDFVELRRHFTTEQIVELGMLCAQYVGFSRFVVSFGVFDGSCPISQRPVEAAPAAV
jgi:alkylhydroperoxidase family enzyme